MQEHKAMYFQQCGQDCVQSPCWRNAMCLQQGPPLGACEKQTLCNTERGARNTGKQNPYCSTEDKLLCYQTVWWQTQHLAVGVWEFFMVYNNAVQWRYSPVCVIQIYVCLSLWILTEVNSVVNTLHWSTTQLSGNIRPQLTESFHIMQTHTRLVLTPTHQNSPSSLLLL